MHRTPQRREIIVNSVRLSCLEWGEPIAGRPSLLAVHGLLAAGETFDHLIARLSPGEHVFAIDLPANGHSEPQLDIDRSFRDLAELVYQFIVQTKLESPIVLGHSHGGTLALTLALLHPGVLSGLILICPAHPFQGYSRFVVRFYLSPPGKALAHLLPYIPRSLYLWTFKRVPGSRKDFGYPELEPYLHTLRRPGTIPYTLGLLASWEKDMEFLRADLATSRIAIPVLLLWGELDVVVPIATAESLMQHMTDARLVRLAHAGHLPNEEDPEACAAVINDWMSAQFPV